MLIVADKYIPFLQGILEEYAEVLYLEPEEITAKTVREADALLIRTRTRCDETLLRESRVKFIATATIGYDHIDTGYCERNDIVWTNSPGCNAQGVCDYVEEAIDCFVDKTDCADRPITIGIVGVGHVGSLVAQMAQHKGFRILLNDPPKGIGVSLDEIARNADIITFHTPLIRTGEYPTWHLCDSSFLDKCKPQTLIINAARGGVLDEEALLSKLSAVGCRLSTVIDTWEKEPHINKALLNKVTIATYHIAGYTLQGKINATNICLAALCGHFSLPVLQIPKKTLPLQPELKRGWLTEIDQQLRAEPDNFEYLRKTYKLR